MGIHTYNFESSYTSDIDVIVVMPIFWRFESSRKNRNKCATVKDVFAHDGICNIWYARKYRNAPRSNIFIFGPFLISNSDSNNGKKGAFQDFRTKKSVAFREKTRDRFWNEKGTENEYNRFFGHFKIFEHDFRTCRFSHVQNILHILLGAMQWTSRTWSFAINEIDEGSKLI